MSTLSEMLERARRETRTGFYLSGAEWVPPGFPLESLGDDAGRQIAADWWEENGEPDRAAALRAMIRTPLTINPQQFALGHAMAANGDIRCGTPVYLTDDGRITIGTG